MKLILPLGTALVMLSLHGVARAQTLQVPSVEIGGQVGLVGAIAEGVHTRPIVGPRLTLNISRQHAIELAAETLVPDAGLEFTGCTFFNTSTRPGARPIGRHSTVLHGRNRRLLLLPKIPEQRVPRPDGSVVVYPAHSTGELSRLTVVAFGGGFERGLNRYASFRLEGSGFVVRRF